MRSQVVELMRGTARVDGVHAGHGGGVGVLVQVGFVGVPHAGWRGSASARVHFGFGHEQLALAGDVAAAARGHFRFGNLHHVGFERRVGFVVELLVGGFGVGVGVLVPDQVAGFDVFRSWSAGTKFVLTRQRYKRKK